MGAWLHFAECAKTSMPVIQFAPACAIHQSIGRPKGAWEAQAEVGRRASGLSRGAPLEDVERQSRRDQGVRLVDQFAHT
jgi:hypothetical protein